MSRLSVFGMPIGFVEVKKPNQYSMKDCKALGKRFDYLTRKHLQEGAMHAVYSPSTMNGVSHGYLMLKLKSWPS